MTGADIVAEARTWLGTPWVHQASVKGAGCDCIGFVVGVAEAFGIPEAKAWKNDLLFRGYPVTPVMDKLLAAVEKYLDPVSVPRIEPGDILVFNLIIPQHIALPMHFGIVSQIKPTYIIHAHAPKSVGRVVENILDDKWLRRVHSARRYRGKV